MHRQKESRSDLISVSCGTSCTATWLWANLAWAFSTGWIGRLGRWRYDKPLSTSLPSQGPVFLTTSEGVYCCAVFSHCPSTAVSASSIFIYVYLKDQHALLLLLSFFQLMLCYVSVTTEVILPLQACALVLSSSIAVHSVWLTSSVAACNRDLA